MDGSHAPDPYRRTLELGRIPPRDGEWRLHAAPTLTGWVIRWGRSGLDGNHDWWPTEDPTIYKAEAECEEAILRHMRARTPMGEPPF